LENDGTATWSGGRFVTNNASTINNTGTWTVPTAQAGLAMFNNSGAPSNFNNSGTLSKTGDTNAASIQIGFNNNSGTVAARTGTLNLSGGTSTGGIYTADSGAYMNFTGGGTQNLSGALSGTGAGTIDFNSGTLNIMPAGATFTFDPGVFTWTGGTLTGPNATLTNAGDLTLTGNGDKSISNVTLTNAGTMEWTGTGRFLAYNASTINNNATFTILTAQSNLLSFNNGGLPSTFNNNGTLAKAGDVNTASLVIAVNNAAVIAVHNGALNLGGGTSTDGSSYAVDAGTSLDLTGGNLLTVSGTISGSGAGIVTFSGGTINVPSAGATFNFSPGVLQWTGGTLFTSDGGTLSNVGSMTITGSADKTINTNTPQNNQIFTLDNEGAILWTGTGRIITYNGVILNNGTTFDMQTNDQVALNIFNNGGLLSTFINAGSLTKSAGLRTVEFGIDFENRGGSVTISAGGIDFYAGGHGNGNMAVAATTNLSFSGSSSIFYLDAGASITGLGTTTLSGATLEVRAVVSANEFVLANGNLQIDDTAILNLPAPSNYTQINGTLTILMSGTTAGAGYGQLNVGAAAHLGSNLSLVMLNGYRPAAGDAFTVLTYASHTQTFGNIFGLDVGGGIHLNPVYSSGDLTLTAVQTDSGRNGGIASQSLTAALVSRAFDWLGMATSAESAASAGFTASASPADATTPVLLLPPDWLIDEAFVGLI
jgi:hypothetical protein